MRLFPGLLILCTLLTGCAGLTEDECTVGEWSKIGSNDAAQGLEASMLAEHTKACKRYNILPDQTRYIEGYRRGLVTYCTPTNGFNVGRNGYEYRKICPKGTEAVFLKGYQRGTNLHRIETSIAKVRNSLGKAQKQIEEIKAARPNESKNDLMRLNQEKRLLGRKLAQLERDRNRALLEADSFLQTISPDI